MSQVPAIAFPEVVQVERIERRHPLLRHVSLLSRRTISVVVLIYAIAKFLIQPNIELTFMYRFQLQALVIKKLKELTSKLQTKVKSPPKFHVTYNGKIMVDRTIHTEGLEVSNGKGVRFDEEKPVFETLHYEGQRNMDQLVSKLKGLKTSLELLPVPQLNKWDGSYGIGGNKELNSLFFHTKQLKSYLDIVVAEHPRDMLFKRPVSHFGVTQPVNPYVHNNYLDILHNDLIEIKSIINS